MASGTAITPETLREISGRITKGATDVQAILSRLASHMAPVRAEWVGSAQMQFNGLWDQVQRDASGLQAVLTDIAEFTGTASVTPSTRNEQDASVTPSTRTEQSIAGTFADFRAELDKLSDILGPLECPPSHTDLGPEGTPSHHDPEPGTTAVDEDLARADIDDIEGAGSESAGSESAGNKSAGSEGAAIEVVERSADGSTDAVRGPWARFMTPNAWRDIEAGRN